MAVVMAKRKGGGNEVVLTPRAIARRGYPLARGPGSVPRAVYHRWISSSPGRGGRGHMSANLRQGEAGRTGTASVPWNGGQLQRWLAVRSATSFFSGVYT